MVEAGYKDFVFDTYTALMAPVKTPPEIVRQLEKVALEILNRPEMRAKLTQSGFDVTAQGRQGPHGARRQGGADVPRHHHPGGDQEAVAAVVIRGRHPEERAQARVSKAWRTSARGHGSRRTLRVLLSMRPEHADQTKIVFTVRASISARTCA